MAENQVITQDDALGIGPKIPELLNKSQAALVSARAAVENFGEVTDNVSKDRAFELRDKIRGAKNTYKDLRMPFTRQLDDIKKKFTTTESGFDALVSALQAKLDGYARIELERQRAAAKEAEKQAASGAKAIEMQHKCRAILEGRISAALDRVRSACAVMVEQATEQTRDDIVARLSVEPQWRFHDEFIAVPQGVDAGVFSEILQQHYEPMKSAYLSKAAEIMSDTVAIVDVAINNGEQARKLQQAEAERIEAERIEAEKARVASLEAEMALLELDTTPDIGSAPKVKVKYKINVTSPDAWLKIIAFWYENDAEGRDKLNNDTRKTFQQCKKFAEKLAYSEGAMIEHPGIEYIEEVKAGK